MAANDKKPKSRRGGRRPGSGRPRKDRSQFGDYQHRTLNMWDVAWWLVTEEVKNRRAEGEKGLSASSVVNELIVARLSSGFPSRYSDPEPAPEVEPGKVIDLMTALKLALQQRQESQKRNGQQSLRGAGE